jgi:hypothetical protein
MPRHKRGTLVRVRTEEEVGEEQYGENSTKEMVEQHGWLYTVVRFLPAHHGENENSIDAYECKSLATGELIQLFPEEITTKELKHDRQEDESRNPVTPL